MKVKVLKNFTHNGKKWKKGQIVEFTNDLCQKWIKAGKVGDTDAELPEDERRNKIYSEEAEE